jgi:hypothetical protein
VVDFIYEPPGRLHRSGFAGSNRSNAWDYVASVYALRRVAYFVFLNLASSLVRSSDLVLSAVNASVNARRLQSLRTESPDKFEGEHHFDNQHQAEARVRAAICVSVVREDPDQDHQTGYAKQAHDFSSLK